MKKIELLVVVVVLLIASGSGAFADNDSERQVLEAEKRALEAEKRAFEAEKRTHELESNMKKDNPQSNEAKRDANGSQISVSNIEHNAGVSLTYYRRSYDFYSYGVINAVHTEWHLGTYYKGYLPITNLMALGFGARTLFVWVNDRYSGEYYDDDYSIGDDVYLYQLLASCRFGRSRVKNGEIYLDLTMRDGAASFWGVKGRYEYLGADLKVVIGDEYVMNWYLTLDGYLSGGAGRVEFVPKIGYESTKNGGGIILEAGINYFFKSKKAAVIAERNARMEERVSERTAELAAPRPESRSETEQVLLESGMIVLDAVYFETGKADIHRNSKPYLKTLAKMLVKYPKLKLEIGGHTDNTGSLQVNMALSQKRADAVVDFMNGQEPGLSDMLSAKGYGPTEPTADNNTEEGRETNRRVELKVLNPEVLSEYK